MPATQDPLKQRCEVRFACHGEYPKSRFAVTADGEPGLHCLCAGWYEFFTHIDGPMKTLVALRDAGRPASDLMAIMSEEMPGIEAQAARAPRNAPCPCGSGSGRKAKHCHGGSHPLPELKPTAFPVSVGAPRARVVLTKKPPGFPDETPQD